MLLTAWIVGGIAALLGYARGSKVPTAILTGGGAVADTVLLLIAIAALSTRKVEQRAQRLQPQRKRGG